MKRSIIDSFNNAVNGIILTIKSERNMTVHYLIAIGVITLSLFFNFTRIEFLILLLATTFVVVMEMINTAIEKTVDMITEEYHPFARIIKDISAGAVLVSAINAVIVGYLLFFDRISLFGEGVLIKIQNSPIHMTFVALIVVVLMTIGLKAKYHKGKGTHFQGGVVSGHSAIAFCTATIVAFLAESMLVSTLTVGLALLVGESRIEGKIHSKLEVFLGAILGILVGIIVFKIIR